VAHGDAFPLQQLVLHAVNGFNPPLGVSLRAIAAISNELVAEDSFCRFVAIDLSVVAVSVLEQVTSGHDSRLGISDRLYVRAVDEQNGGELRPNDSRKGAYKM
jgi:hypothetical protein